MYPLKTRAQFDAVMQRPAIAKSPHFALHRLMLGPAESALFPTPLAPDDGPWVGAVIPRRWARRAVTRNLLRRQMSRAGAALPPQPAAYVLRLHRAFDRSRYRSSASALLKRDAFDELQALVQRAAPRSA